MLFITVSIVPVINAVAIVLVPLPLFYFYMKCGDTKAMGIFLVSLAVAFAVLSHLEAGGNIYMLYLLGAFGLILPAMIVRLHTIEKTVVYSAASLVMLGAMLVTAHSLVSGRTPFGLVETYMASAVQESIDAYSTTGAGPEQVEFLKSNASWVASMMMQLAPSLVAAGTCFLAWLNILAGKMLCKATRVTFPDLGDLSRWKIDDRVIWFAIASGILILIPLPSVRVPGLNMLILSLFLYLLQGMAIISYYFENRGVPMYLRLPAYILIFIQAIFLFAVIVVGVADIWIDFRKLQRVNGATPGG
ncbi:MAG: DUF2232 domain-containing protein [Deltaproteobacteria bacterium]|nr:DUF2232 domain-containing protein [Deltaproteobacteria bacterium]